MESLANNTAGEFYLASNAMALTEIYHDIHEKIDLSIASDEDGLYDYSERKTKNGKVVAPVDPQPLHKNGPDGMWDYHVYQQEHGVVATEYVEEDGMQLEEIIKYIQENIYADFPNAEELAENIVELIIKLEDPIEQNGEIIRFVTSIVRKFCNAAFHTEGGAYLLNFVQDTDGVAYHSQPETWQRYFGYNRFYDLVFDVGSDMHHISYNFAIDTENRYVLWMWKGDYWNLHSGAEIGLYTNPQVYGDLVHYNVIDFELPMTLSLYNYYDAETIDNIFNWAPEEEQWWITGFSGQNQAFMNLDPKKMVVVGSVDLSSNVGMYEALKKTYNEYTDLELIFDDTKQLVWINWYEGVL